MARGDFGKAFSEHRKNGGTLSRKDFGTKYKEEHPKKEESVVEEKE